MIRRKEAQAAEARATSAKVGRRRKISSRSSSVRVGSDPSAWGSGIGGAGKAMAAANRLPAPGEVGLWEDRTEGIGGFRVCPFGEVGEALCGGSARLRGEPLRRKGDE